MKLSNKLLLSAFVVILVAIAIIIFALKSYVTNNLILQQSFLEQHKNYIIEMSSSKSEPKLTDRFGEKSEARLVYYRISTRGPVKQITFNIPFKKKGRSNYTL